jgi:hypothetical protein
VWDFLIGTGYYLTYPDGIPTAIYRNAWYNLGNVPGILCPGDT